MLLSHFTHKPLQKVHSVKQIHESFAHTKPKGLWVSVDGDDDWPAWCTSEIFGLGALRYRVTLKSLDSVLLIATAGGLLDFTDTYGRQSDYHYRYIDWPAVAKEHSGIIISPYQWELRLDNRTHWYYGWDCASGCIWNADIIDSITEMECETPNPPTTRIETEKEG